MSDLAYASMAEWQQNVVRPFAGATGLPPGTVLFTLALFASLPLGFGFAAVPGAFAKNLYSLATGTALSYFAFGGSTVTCLYMGAASYLAMALDRRRCGYVVFAGSFGYLIRYHATSVHGNMSHPAYSSGFGKSSTATRRKCALRFAVSRTAPASM